MTSAGSPISNVTNVTNVTDSGSKRNSSAVTNVTSVTSSIGESNDLSQSLEVSGREWERIKGECINGSNLTEFCLWYCEQAGNGNKPSEIRAIAEKVFKITPEPHTRPQAHKESHLSYLCTHSQHNDCGGFECDCDCHIHFKEAVAV